MDDFEFIAKAMLGSRETIARLNTVREELCFIKCEMEAVPLGTPLEFSSFVRKYLKNGNVHPEDKGYFQRAMNPELLRERCGRGESGILFSYRRVEEAGISWHRIVLAIPEDYSREQPEVLLFSRKMSRREADIQDTLRVIGNRVRKVINADKLKGTSRLICLQDREENARNKCGYLSFDGGEGLIEEEYVYPGDLEEFRAETNFSQLVSYFQYGNEEKTIYYRRKTGSLYRWVRLSIAPAADYTPENPVLIYLVEDVHRSMVRFFAKQGNTAFAKKYKRTNEGISAFYENVLNALSFFTQKYLDFCVIDLERDMYIKYKVDRGVVAGDVPYVGSYSKFFSTLISEEEREALQGYATAARLRKTLSTRIAADFTLKLESGERVRVLFTRLAMVDGVPTKVICRVMRHSQEGRLRVKTFGSFEVLDAAGIPIRFTKKKSKQLLAYLVDKRGHTVSTTDIVRDVLEKPENDLNAKKYVSALIKIAVQDLEKAGYSGIIRKEWNSTRVDVEKLNCDYYHLLEGDTSYWQYYRNEYMKDYPWAQATNAALLRSGMLR